MELGFLLLVMASGAGGIVCRKWVGRPVGRFLLVIGLLSLTLGLLILGLTVFGLAPIGVWSAGFSSVILLLLAAAVLPFAVAASFGHE